jgi:hypothetical protein
VHRARLGRRSPEFGGRMLDEREPLTKIGHCWRIWTVRRTFDPWRSRSPLLWSSPSLTMSSKMLIPVNFS